MSLLFLQSCDQSQKACLEMVKGGFRPIAIDRGGRFQGKVQEPTAVCRGGQDILAFLSQPWVDWGHYFGTSDAKSLSSGETKPGRPLSKSGQGVNGALLDLEYQRIELIKFNLFDNNGTYKDYILGRNGTGGPALRQWESLRLPSSHPDFGKLAVAPNGDQTCKGDLIRKRTLTGICNDVLNPLMGSTTQLFARNVEFGTSFPDLGKTELVRNRHGDRLGLLKPDPQLISRRLFTRVQSNPDACKAGFGKGDNSVDSNCDYEKAPFFNVLAAFWIQFMTHDWFSHMEEGRNTQEWMKVGCDEEMAKKYGCRPGDRIDKGFVADSTDPTTFKKDDKEYMARAPRTMKNTNTAWWDASQIYGYDETSVKRVKRDPADPAKLQLIPAASGEKFLPLLTEADPMLPDWKGQEATAFPDNYTIGISFFTTVFAREHNAFVEEFRKRARATPTKDSGLRNPENPKKVITYAEVTPDELFDAARLVVSAEIAKIHTIEWTPQLLYDEPLYRAMNANWSGLLGDRNKQITKILRDIVNRLNQSSDPTKATQWYSVFASGPGIFGLGSQNKHYDMNDPKSLNLGVNHFGSPFNFPEEFITVYRLHPLVPDLIEYRDIKDANQIQAKIPIIETFRGKATEPMRSRGLANWALSMGRQRLGLLTLGNHPQFLQNLTMQRLNSETKQIDVAALDLIRDREHGVPRFNEFRRQYGLRTLTSFDDFINPSLPAESTERKRQQDMVTAMREIYGQHVCDETKPITDAQWITEEGRKPINDCLGKPNGSTVDNIEDVDTIVGWLAEPVRPHGFAISETQFVVFILNASRRLFSDRFLTSGFRPEFYTQLGVDWVNNNGPDGAVMEKGEPNGHSQPVSPLKRVLLRAAPELAPELAHVVNAFDPWARDRGQYYTIEWKPRPDAKTDPAFAEAK